MEMLTVRYISKHGYILSIEDLRTVLAGIGEGSKRWWIEEPVKFVRDPEKPHVWVTIYHSAPTPYQMTDQLSFQVPVLPFSAVVGREESALVCLDPEAIRPLMEGLYLDNDRIVGDFLEDWHLFWEPIKKAISPTTST